MTKLPQQYEDLEDSMNIALLNIICFQLGMIATIFCLNKDGF